jgi:hypothetical protein
MSTAWVERFIPFIEGLDLSKEALLDGQAFYVAENVSWDHAGAIFGRPSRAAADPFVVARAWPQYLAPSYKPAVAFDQTGFVPRGLFGANTPLGPRTLLACDGRLFSHGDGQWTDQGPFASLDTSRSTFFVSGLSTTTPTRLAAAPDFVPPNVTNTSGGPEQFGTSMPFVLLDSDGHDTQTINTGRSGTAGVGGNSARMGAVTALVQMTDIGLTLFRRTAGGTALTTSVVATDADPAPTNALLPVMCASTNHLYVAYHTSGNQYKVVQLSSSDYSVIASYTGIQTGLVGLWIDVTPDESSLVVALTSSVGKPAFQGVTIKVLDSSLHDKALDSTLDVGLPFAPGEVVVGLVQPPGYAMTAWFAYRQNYTDNTGASKPADIVLGTASITTANSATLQKRFYGDGNYGSSLYLLWSICHQPILFNGRVYLTLVTACATNSSNVNWAGTWITWDVTDVPNGADAYPAARGPTDGTYPATAAARAIPLTDGTGWQFTTTDWIDNEAIGLANVVGGLTPCGVMNYVRALSPRSVDINGTTMFSGSVPYVWDGSRCREFGFPFMGGTPTLTASIAAGGTMPAGSYTVTAVWRYTDSAGNVVRSASAAPVTVTTLSGYQQILVEVVSPVTGRFDAAYVDVYCTDVNPTADSPHYYVGSVGANATGSMSGLYITSVNVNNDPVYTDGALQNGHARASGGIATMGRRVWVADDRHLYASKLPEFRTAVEFQEDGVLDITLPSSAGRIRALEEFRDRLFVFCQRGVFVLADGGPDNTGAGLTFDYPQRYSDLGIEYSRATCRMDSGILFVVPQDTVDERLGGPYLADGTNPPQFLGDGIRAYNLADGLLPEVAFSPARNSAFIAYETSAGTGVVLLDQHAHRAATWANQDAVFGATRFICTSGDYLWSLCNEPAPFSGPPGTDAGGHDYAMTLTTNHLFSGAQNGVAWSRVRGARVLGTPRSGAYVLTMSALLDQERYVTSGPQPIAAPSSGSTWPSGRQLPEWRLPTQKCSSIQMTLSATPATAEWAALSLSIRPTAASSPAGQRF